MRKAQKEQAEKLIGLLGRIHDGIRLSIEIGHREEALDYLGQCQSGAISLGEAIEETEGEGFVTVKLLEAYCETVYQIYEKLQKEQGIGANQAYKSLRKSLTQVKNSVQNDLRVRTEAVFLPYKASMWDSLESVWKAADEDPDCDAYVIPIPYYDKNPDGSFREEHYEGDLYPDEVPVTRYQDYDFAEHRPDLVFIHNPYDECNYVTSVHPFFYARNLKQYAGKLIYIPYFVLGDSMYESMCVAPGTILADMIAAQSERAKEDFTIHLKRWYQENTDADDRALDTLLMEKIQPTGSPKIDKVVNSDRSCYSLPEAWERLLRGKKAVLYNTGVTGLLNGNEQELKKIRDTIEFFRSREDVVLWWRPHPLSVGTMHSMRPELYEEYLGIVEEYKASGFGIFDGTTDLHRALLWTDLYYGDDSSLIFLYGIQGKPIVLQNIFYLTKEQKDKKDRSISYSVSCLVSDTVYFTARNYNRLYRLDLNNGSVDEIGEAPNEYKIEMSLYSNMIYEDGILWLIPSRAHALAAYHLESGEWTQYALPDRIKASAKIDGKIYMVSSDYRHLWTMDLRTEVLEKETIQYQDEKLFPVSEEYYNGDLYRIGDKLYYLITHSSFLAEYDLQSKKAAVHQIGPDGKQYQRLLYQEGSFWFLPSDHESAVIRWDGTDISTLPDGNCPDGFSYRWGFLHAACRKEDILLFPQRGNTVLRLDKKNMQTECMLAFGRDRDVQDVKLMPDGRILFMATTAGMDCHMTIMDPGGSILYESIVECPEDSEILSDRIFERLDQEKYHSRWGYQISEMKEFDLAVVCDALTKTESVSREEKNYFRNLYANGNGSSGMHIWEKVKGI